MDLGPAVQLVARFGDPDAVLRAHVANDHGCCSVCTVHGARAVRFPCVIAAVGQKARAMQLDLKLKSVVE